MTINSPQSEATVEPLMGGRMPPMRRTGDERLMAEESGIYRPVHLASSCSGDAASCREGVDLNRAFCGMAESEPLGKTCAVLQAQLQLFTLVGVMLNNADSVTSVMEPRLSVDL